MQGANPPLPPTAALPRKSDRRLRLPHIVPSRLHAALNLRVPYHVLQTGFLPRAITDKLHHERKPTNRPNGLIERALLDAFPRVFYSALHGERNFVILYAAEMMLTCASEKRNRSILK